MRQVYFHQDCGCCGRPMLVQVQLMGERIECGHCRAECDARRAAPKRGALAQFVSSKLGRLSSLRCDTSPAGHRSSGGTR